MGTPNLVKRLSELIGDVTQQTYAPAEIHLHVSSHVLIIHLNRIPDLRKECTELQLQLKDELRALAVAPARDHTAELLRRINTFSSEVGQVMDGRNGQEELLVRCLSAYMDFKWDIRCTEPVMTPGGSSAAAMYEDDMVAFGAHFNEDTPGQEESYGQLLCPADRMDLVALKQHTAQLVLVSDDLRLSR